MRCAVAFALATCAAVHGAGRPTPDDCPYAGGLACAPPLAPPPFPLFELAVLHRCQPKACPAPESFKKKFPGGVPANNDDAGLPGTNYLVLSEKDPNGNTVTLRPFPNTISGFNFSNFCTDPTLLVRPPVCVAPVLHAPFQNDNPPLQLTNTTDLLDPITGLLLPNTTQFVIGVNDSAYAIDGVPVPNTRAPQFTPYVNSFPRGCQDLFPFPTLQKDRDIGLLPVFIIVSIYLFYALAHTCEVRAPGPGGRRGGRGAVRRCG